MDEFNRRCYKDILEAEEDRVETGLARDDMEATGVFASFTEDSNALYVGGEAPLTSFSGVDHC